MTGQMNAIYDGYVKSVTANNVEPSVVIHDRAEVWQMLRDGVTGFDFDKPHSFTNRYWDSTTTGRAFRMDDGRIAEYSVDNTAFRIPLLAIFDTEDDWFNYRQPMGRFHYFNT